VERADAALPPGDRPPLPPVVALHVEVVQAEAALVRWTESGQAAELETANRHLQAALQHDAGYTHAQLLARVTAEARGDTAAASRLRERVHPQRRHVEARWFDQGLPALAPYLRAHVHGECRGDVILAQAPAACALAAGSVPADYAAFEQAAWVSHGESRFETWNPRLSGYTHEELFAALGLERGQAVADVGAGEGWLSLPLAAWLGEDGWVVATDRDPVLLEFLSWGARWHHLDTVDTLPWVAGTAGLPPGEFDVVLVCELFKTLTTNARATDTAHLEQEIYPFLRNLRAALRPEGRFIFLERRTPPEDPDGVSPETIRRHAEAVGFRFEREIKDFRPAMAAYRMTVVPDAPEPPPR